MQCWQDIAQFQQFLMCMLSQLGPYPVQGVTDGSDAKPGNIGEYIMLSVAMPFAANPANTQQVVSAGVLPPGDWQIYPALQLSTIVGSAQFWLTPQPAGVTNDMAGTAGTIGIAGSETAARVIGQIARGSFTVPTLLAFTVHVDQSTATGLAAGTATLDVEARRMR
jgi:hypothetical protein